MGNLNDKEQALQTERLEKQEFWQRIEDEHQKKLLAAWQAKQEAK